MCTYSDFHEKGGSCVHTLAKIKTFRSQWIRRYTSVGCFCSSSTPRHPSSTFSLITRKSFESSIQLWTYSPRHELLSEFGVRSVCISAKARVNKNGKLLNCSYRVNSFININHFMFCHVGVGFGCDNWNILVFETLSCSSSSNDTNFCPQSEMENFTQLCSNAGEYVRIENSKRLKYCHWWCFTNFGGYFLCNWINLNKKVLFKKNVV